MLRRVIPALLALALSCSVLGGLPTVGPVGPATAGTGVEDWERTPATLDTTTGPAEDQPVTLDYDIYVPAGASAADPRPAMITAHGFGNAKDVNEMLTLSAFFASKGYVVLASSHQGFGQSSGCVELDSIDYDSLNVSRLIDVLAQRDDVLMDRLGDPRVGMVGGSYGGGHQGGVAARDPRLDAMSPGRTWNSLQFSLVPNNLVGSGGLYDIEHYAQGVFKQVWTSLFFSLGSASPAMGTGGCDPATQQQLFPGQPPCSGFDPAVCPIFASLAATGDVSDEQRAFVARSSITNFTDAVDIPILLTQGESDTLFTLVEATATFEQVKAAGNDDVFLLWNWGGHGYQPRPGEGEPYSGAFDDTSDQQEAFRATYFADRLGRFFDHFLRDEGHPGPRFAYFRDWVDYEVTTADDGRVLSSAAEAYAETGRAPTNDGVDFLLGDDGLVAEGAEAAPALDASLLNPPDGRPAAHSETPNFSGDGQPGAGVPPSEVAGQNVTLDTPPFTAPAQSVGIGTVRVHVANANGRDPILFTKLYDVAPDGSATLIRRLVAASRIPADQLPGTVELRLPGIAHQFDVGHVARLVIATTDDSYRNASAPDTVSLTSDPADPAVLHLPLDNGDTVGRTRGPNRIGTAVALSEQAFGEARVAVLASANSFADALSAGPLAAALNAPLLLTGRDALDPRVAADLRRLGAEEVIVVGGVAAVSASVADAVRDMDLRVTRLAGAGRLGTNRAIVERLATIAGGSLPTAVLARAYDFADALAAGGLAIAQGGAIVLVDRNLPDTARELLDDVLAAGDGVVVAGGTAAVPQVIVDGLGRPARRVAGIDRYATGGALVQAAIDAGASPQPLLLASGDTFPDALAAVPAASALGGLVLIIPPSGVTADTSASTVLRTNADIIDGAFLVGGTAALPEALRPQVAPQLVG